MKKTKKGKRNSVQELLGIQRFTRYGLLTDLGELVFFRVAPTNISVLSRMNIENKISHLKDLLTVEPDTEIICTDSCECFDDNREYLQRRVMEETNPKVRQLLEQDRKMLTQMQAEMANAREFFFAKRYTGMKPSMVFASINDVLKRITERGFEVQHMKKADIKRMLAIYLGSSMDGDKLPDIDGGQFREEAANGPV